MSRSSTPGSYSVNVEKPINSSVMEDLNRTWPSTSVSDVSGKNFLVGVGAPGSAISVSAAKSHFEQMSKSR